MCLMQIFILGVATALRGVYSASPRLVVSATGYARLQLCVRAHSYTYMKSYNFDARKPRDVINNHTNIPGDVDQTRAAR